MASSPVPAAAKQKIGWWRWPVAAVTDDHTPEGLDRALATTRWGEVRLQGSRQRPAIGTDRVGQLRQRRPRQLQVAVHFASNDATPSRRSDRRAHIKPSSYEAVIASSGAWRAGRRARRCKARTKIDIDEQRHGDLAERTLRVAEVVAERRERGPTVQRRGVLSRGTCSPGKGKPGGVPSPKGRPPSASRPWGSSQLAKSGPAGTIWVGFTEVWTT